MAIRGKESLLYSPVAMDQALHDIRDTPQSKLSLKKGAPPQMLTMAPRRLVFGNSDASNSDATDSLDSDGSSDSGVHGGDEAAVDPKSGAKRGKPKKKPSAGKDGPHSNQSTPERPVKTPLNATPERQPRPCTEESPRKQRTSNHSPRRRLNVENYTTVRRDDKPIHELVAQLDSEMGIIVSEAAEALQVRALHAPEHVRHEIAVSGAIEKLMSKLGVAGATSERAISTMQNLSAEVRPDDFIKQTMVDKGMLDKLLNMIESRFSTAKAIATMMNLIIGSNDRKQDVVEMGGVDSLAPLLATADAEIRFLAINTLTSLAIGSNERKQIISRTPKLLQTTIGMLDVTESDITQLNALELIQSLVLGSAERKRAVIDIGFIPRLSELLTSHRCSVEVKDVGEQLLKGFSEFLGWESKTTTMATDITARGGVRDDLGVLSPLLPCIAPFFAPLRAIAEKLGMA